MKILISGASGLLGSYLLKTQPIEQSEGVAVSNLHEIVPCYWNNPIKGVRLNLLDPIKQLFEINPDVIIHTAANGDLDSVEKNPTGAVKTDLQATINLVDYCEKMKCKLVTISSNAVYAGSHPPYSEQSPRNPVNFYGKIKSLADDIVKKSSCEWMIIRPIYLYGYGPHRDNWVTKIIKGGDFKLVNDYFIQPTYAKEVAKCIWTLIETKQFNQEFNIASDDRISIYELGLKVKEVFELKGKIETAKLSDFNIAPRATDTTFETSKIKNLGFRFSGVEEGLKLMKNEN